MMHNNLFLNKMVVYTNDGQIAYNETFHKGVNIIRGDNSSGKSTITHFIFYVLGGAFNDWVKEAKKCSLVIAEVEMNGATITIKRHIKISEKTKKANDKESMFFYWGNFEEAQSNNEWQKFNFNSFENIKSYSNVIFENLDIPIVKGENNITFHQILRLLYVDQESPTNSLFLYEQFDSSLTRETVSDLLMGVYNQDLYDKKQRLVNADKELDDTKKEIKIIKKFISNPLDLIPSNINTAIDNKEKEISELETKIIELKEKTKKVRYTKKTKLDFEILNASAIEQREKIKKLEIKIRTFKFEINDTIEFIEALKNKLKAIKKSILTRKLLGDFPLENCPECLSEIEPIEFSNTCKLCKTEIDDSFGITQARKIEQELGFQIKESNNLVAIKKREIIDLDAQFEVEKLKHYQIQQQVNHSLEDVKSLREEKYDNLYIDKGFLEGEIIQLRTLLENAGIFQSLRNKQRDLDQETDTLKFSISKITKEQIRLKKETLKSIENKGIHLLNNDLRRQKDFYQAKEFQIDFRNNIAFISDKDAKYSASSSFYLKISARFSLFLASLEIEKMRYPRFIFCDNMEDKGIEKKRAQNFQRILVAETEKNNSANYQMIYTTSFIPEEFNNEKYCVGEFYTEENPSLKNV
jgi:hypothetical protein